MLKRCFNSVVKQARPLSCMSENKFLIKGKNICDINNKHRYSKDCLILNKSLKTLYLRER